MKKFRTNYYFVLVLIAIVLLSTTLTANADTAREIDLDVDHALSKLYLRVPVAERISRAAKGVLVFPNIVKGGFVVGGHYGEGALQIDGKTKGYYSNAAASYGLQIGVQSFGYAMFLMTDSALEYLEKSDGWEVGVGPNFVIVDEGKAKSLTTSTLKQDIYVFIFNQKGLMAGLGIQGSKITKITPR